MRLVLLNDVDNFKRVEVYAPPLKQEDREELIGVFELSLGELIFHKSRFVDYLVKQDIVGLAECIPEVERLLGL